MDRRQFVQAGALAAGAAGILTVAGCGRPTETQAAAPVGPAPPTGAGASATPPSEGPLAGKVGRNRAFAQAPGAAAAAVATKRSPAELVAAALEALGGISLFIQKGDRVVIKPNLAWARDPEGGATTHPEVLAAAIKLAQSAGAGEVLVVEHSCDSSAVTFEMSGGGAVCQAAGVHLISLDSPSMYREQALSRGTNIKVENLPHDILDCDCYINLPCLKHHGATNMTFALKNQMGAIQDPGRYHREGGGAQGLHQNIADLATGLRPTLTIGDATRCLTDNGPKGPGNVTRMDTVIATHDMVLADALGAELMGLSLDQVAHVGLAASLGVGSLDTGAGAVVRV